MVLMLRGLFQEKYMVIVLKRDNKKLCLTNQCHSSLNTRNSYIMILATFILPLEGVIGFILALEMVQPRNITLNL